MPSMLSNIRTSKTTHCLLNPEIYRRSKRVTSLTVGSSMIGGMLYHQHPKEALLDKGEARVPILDGITGTVTVGMEPMVAGTSMVEVHHQAMSGFRLGTESVGYHRVRRHLQNTVATGGIRWVVIMEMDSETEDLGPLVLEVPTSILIFRVTTARRRAETTGGGIGMIPVRDTTGEEVDALVHLNMTLGVEIAGQGVAVDLLSGIGTESGSEMVTGGRNTWWTKPRNTSRRSSEVCSCCQSFLASPRTSLMACSSRSPLLKRLTEIKTVSPADAGSLSTTSQSAWQQGLVEKQ